MEILSQGDMLFNKELGFYEKEVDVNGINIGISIHATPENIDDRLVFGNKVLNWYKENEQNVKQYAASQLLEIKNKEWTDKDEKEITGEEFVNLMSIDDISISDQTVDFYFNAGGMFTDHSIIVRTRGENFDFIQAIV